MTDPIPLVDLRAQYEPLKDEIRRAWDEVLAGMHLFLGPNVQALEKEFASFCGVTDAIGVSEGTSAVNLALRACDIGAGDEVITVSHTFIATVEAIVLAGARPVFVDVDPHTCLMDVNQVEREITAKTRAILPVHLYGQCVDMDPLLEIARKHNLYVIEDACQAHGATYKGRRAGSMGAMGAFSFYYTKNLGGYGEGGMVTSSNAELVRRVRRLRDHGSEKRYYHEEIGINGRLDELQAAALRVKLPHLETWNDQRRANAALYNQALAGSGVATPFEAEYGRGVYHLYVIRTARRDALREYLNTLGIGTGIHYPVPIHLQKPCLQYGAGEGSLPMTEQVVAEILSLPMYPELTNEQILRVAGEIRAFLSKPV